MEPGKHPPIRELLNFENTHLSGGVAGDMFLTVSGTQPDAWIVELEDDPDPSIPEPEWVRWQIVGYHFGEYRPDPKPYSVTRQVPELPPGAKGIEIVGKDKTTRVPIGGGEGRQ
jgi:hypothetical protein